MRPGKNVAVRVDRERTNIGRGQAIVHERPIIAVVRRTEDARSAPRRPGKNVAVGIDREGPDVSAGQSLVHRHPGLAVIGGAVNPERRVSPGENVSTRVDCEGPHVGRDDARG